MGTEDSKRIRKLTPREALQFLAEAIARGWMLRRLGLLHRSVTREGYGSILPNALTRANRAAQYSYRTLCENAKLCAKLSFVNSSNFCDCMALSALESEDSSGTNVPL